MRTGMASSSHPTVCLSVLDSRARWQGPGVTFTTDRLGRRCLELSPLPVKDSFVKKPRGSHAGTCNAWHVVNSGDEHVLIAARSHLPIHSLTMQTRQGDLCDTFTHYHAQ